MIIINNKTIKLMKKKLYEKLAAILICGNSHGDRHLDL